MHSGELREEKRFVRELRKIAKAVLDNSQVIFTRCSGDNLDSALKRENIHIINISKKNIKI